MKKTLLIASAALVGVAVAVVLGVWLFFDANQFRPKVEALVGGALGRKVSVGNLRVALLSGGIAVQNLSIADDPGFSTGPFVTARTVTIGVDLVPLIFSRSLRVESFRLEEPQVVLRRSARGAWNFSSLGASSTSATSAPATAMSVLIRKVTIAGGRIIVGETAAGGKERRYDDVTAEATDLSYTGPFPFRITAKTPGGGTVSFEGAAGPLNMKDAAETPFQATVNAQRVDVASSGFIDPSSGLAGMIDFVGALTSDGRAMNAKGKASATKLQLVPGASPARVPVEIDYESDYNLTAQSGVVKQGDVHIGRAIAHLAGAYNTAGESITVRMTLSGQNMPVTELESALPALGLTLPSGASFRRGTLDTDLTISGPLDRIVIAGPVRVSNATVAGFDLGARLGAVAAFAGLQKSGETLIQTLSATLRVAPQGIQVDGLNLVAPAIGTLTGAGTIAPKGAMDFKMNAKVAGAVATGVARVTSFGQPANGIPFRIQGTTSNPIFLPDVGSAVGNLMKNPESAKKVADALRGLFKKKH